MSETWYAVYRKSDGELLSTGRVLADQLPDDRDAIVIDGPQQSGQVWNKQSRQFVAAPPVFTKQYTDAMGVAHTITQDHAIADQDVFNAQFPQLSKLQFRRLFTLNERMALDGFEGSTAPDLVKQTLRTIKADFDAAKYISLDDPMTQQAINAFEQMALIGTGRAAQILSGQIPI
jgi:hypothetical protein